MAKQNATLLVAPSGASPPPSSWHWRYPLTTRAEPLRSVRS